MIPATLIVLTGACMAIAAAYLAHVRSLRLAHRYHSLTMTTEASIRLSARSIVAWAVLVVGVIVLFLVFSR